MAWYMKFTFSKAFIKSSLRLSGKMKTSLQKALKEIEKANSIDEITDCKKLTNFNYTYRIRIGGYRAFFIFHVHIKDDVILFQYLLTRGEAYTKKNMDKLRKNDS